MATVTVEDIEPSAAKPLEQEATAPTQPPEEEKEAATDRPPPPEEKAAKKKPNHQKHMGKNLK